MYIYIYIYTCVYIYILHNMYNVCISNYKYRGGIIARIDKVCDTASV